MAVARPDERLAHLVADGAAVATPGERKLHLNMMPRRLVPSRGPGSGHRMPAQSRRWDAARVSETRVRYELSTAIFR